MNPIDTFYTNWWLFAIFMQLAFIAFNLARIANALEKK